MRVMKVNQREYNKNYVFKLMGVDEDEIVFACDNEENYTKWMKAMKEISEGLTP